MWGRRWRTSARRRPASSRPRPRRRRLQWRCCGWPRPRRCCWRLCSDPSRAPSSRRVWPTSLARAVWVGRPCALRALASALRCCVLAYVAGERGVAQLVESVQDTAVWVVSRQLPWLTTGALALERAGVDVAGAADHAAFVAPSLVDLAGGVEGAVAGPATPLDYEDALVLLARAGATTGRLSEAGRAVVADPRQPTAGARAPTSARRFVGAQLGLGQVSAGPSAGPHRAGAPARRTPGPGSHHPGHPGLGAQGGREPLGRHERPAAHGRGRAPCSPVA